MVEKFSEVVSIQDIMNNFMPLLSGFVGAIIGALATVLATNKIIKSNAAEYAKRREKEKKDEYNAKLKNLENEINFNIKLPNGNKKIAVFIHNGWENFLPYLNKLSDENKEILNEAYSWAICHNSAAKLEKPNVTGYVNYIEKSFDKAIEKFKEFKI